MQWNVFFKGFHEDARAILGVDSNLKLILGDYGEAGHMTDEEVWKLVYNHLRLTTDDAVVRNYSINLASEPSKGFIPNTLELWLVG